MRFHSKQRSKKWHKKPKVKVEDPNKEFVIGSHTYMNASWMFNNKNRDRPTGHTSKYHKACWYFHPKFVNKSRKSLDRFFVNEGLQDHLDEEEEFQMEIGGLFDEDYGEWCMFQQDALDYAFQREEEEREALHMEELQDFDQSDIEWEELYYGGY